jgi:hypothetical protein
MSTDVLTRSRQQRQHASQPQSSGWLVLHRRLLETLQLSTAESTGGTARVTVLNTEPLTLGLDLAGIGTVELSLHPSQRGVKFSIRADESVRIAREELAGQRS